MTTDLLDLSPYTVGKALPEEPVAVISKLLGLDATSYEYTRARYNEGGTIVEYVLVRDRMNNSWKTHRLSALHKLLKETANVP